MRKDRRATRTVARRSMSSHGHGKVSVPPSSGNVASVAGLSAQTFPLGYQKSFGPPPPEATPIRRLRWVIPIVPTGVSWGDVDVSTSDSAHASLPEITAHVVLPVATEVPGIP